MPDTANNQNEVTPDALMALFKGKGLKPIVTFTVVVHAVVLIGTSLPFLVESVFGADHSKRSEDERVKSAVEDATAALRKIAQKHGLNPQDISRQFAGGGSRSPEPADAGEPDADGDEAPVLQAPEDGREKSAYETNLETKAEGPTVPNFEDDEDDIF